MRPGTEFVVIGYVRHYLAVIITAAAHIFLVGHGRERKRVVKQAHHNSFPWLIVVRKQIRPLSTVNKVSYF